MKAWPSLASAGQTNNSTPAELSQGIPVAKLHALLASDAMRETGLSSLLVGLAESVDSGPAIQRISTGCLQMLTKLGDSVATEAILREQTLRLCIGRNAPAPANLSMLGFATHSARL